MSDSMVTRSAGRRLVTAPKTMWAGASLLALPMLVAVLTPLLPLVDPQTQDLASEFAAPSRAHWLGQGENGVDVLSQLLWGCHLSLTVCVVTVILSAFIGTALGLVAGYRGGWLDAVIMRCVDFIYAFPGLLLVVALAAFLGPSFMNLVLILVLSSWAGYARLVRSQVLTLRERNFVQAAQALGVSDSQIAVAHILPNLISSIIVQMSFHFGTVILIESSLSFLGLGVPPGTPSWGQLLNSGREVMTTAPHIILAPGVALFLCVVGFNLLGDGLRDWLDPNLKSRIQ